MTAAGTANQWAVLIPLVVLAWWWSPPGTFWVALQLGLIGIEWAFVGAYALAQVPQHAGVIAAMWVAFPLTLAWLAIRARLDDPTRGF
jgi:hypothetical protein